MKNHRPRPKRRRFSFIESRKIWRPSKGKSHMKTYEEKTLSACLALAQKDTGLSLDILKRNYHIISKKKNLFSTVVTIAFFTEKDVCDFAYEYLDKLLAMIGAKGTYTADYDESSHVITITIKSEDGSKVIGKNGENLKALNTLVRSAIFNKFGPDYRLLLDCDGYKGMKYNKIKKTALAAANDVQRSHIPASLPPMPSDERRIVHETLAGMRNISAESVDDGKKRHIVIKYAPGHICTYDSPDK